MSENGVFVDLKGSSSEIIINKALKFIEEKSNQNKPFFTVIWDGSPHILLWQVKVTLKNSRV